MTKSRSSNTEEKDYWVVPVIGFWISRKLDGLAVIALIISISSILFQLNACAEGVQVRLIPPHQVYFWSEENEFDHKVRVRFGASMSYVNTGKPGYDGIIRREYLRVSINGRESNQISSSFAEFRGNAKKLVRVNEVPVAFFAVNAGATKSHYTVFDPVPVACEGRAKCNRLANHILWSEFLDHLSSLAKQGATSFRFQFIAERFEGKPVTAWCKIEIDERIVGAIRLFGAYNPRCFQ